MTCPPDIARILLQIIREGILAARAASWDGDVKRCEAETEVEAYLGEQGLAG